MGCSKVQRCERADDLQSTMPSYSHPVSFVHQQKDGLESEARDIASRSPASRCASAESTGCFRLTTSNHWGGCEIHARTNSGRVCMSQLVLHGGRNQNRSI